MNRRGRIVAVVFAALVVLGPTVLWAHARLTKSEPAAGAQLRTAPSVIRLWFSEAPEIRMTSVQLRDASGNELPLGTPEPGLTTLEVKTAVPGTLRPGVYHLTWRVAGKDGHPIAGQYSFAVLDSAPTPVARIGPVLIDPPAVIEPADASATTHVIARAFTFAGLLAVVGVVVFQVAVLVRATRIPPPFPDTMTRRAAKLGMTAALIVIVASLARIYLQAGVLARGTRWYSIGVLIFETQWGRVWSVGVALLVIAAIAFRLAGRRRRGAWNVAAFAAVALAFIPSLGGHAIASPRLPVLAVIADGLHVLGAAGWLGSLLCLVVIGFPTVIQDASERRWESASDLVHGFSPVALACAGIVVLTGALSAWLRLGALTPLWTTGYGRVLLVKLLLVAGTAGTGAYNYLRVKPALGTESATLRIRRSAGIELTIGLLVVIVTAILVALPTPLDAG